MNGNTHISQSIQVLLFHTLVQGGVAQLQAKLNAIKRQTSITVTDRNGSVIKALKQLRLRLMPARVPLVGRKPQQLHGMTGSITELPRRNPIRQPLR